MKTDEDRARDVLEDVEAERDKLSDQVDRWVAVHGDALNTLAQRDGQLADMGALVTSLRVQVEGTQAGNDALHAKLNAITDQRNGYDVERKAFYEAFTIVQENRQDLKARIADLQETNGLLNADLSKTRGSLRNLLARIHRDGGHYTADHGEDVSIRDADEKVANLNLLSDLAHEKREL